jgi:SAM-dependent methyltransferase
MFIVDTPTRVRTPGRMLPAIWHGSFASLTDWTAAAPEYAVLAQLAEEIDDRLVVSTRPFALQAWCVVCSAIRPMTVTWRSFFHLKETASIKLAGTEVAHCHGCQLFSRVRALFSLLDSLSLPADARTYIAEQVTATYQQMRQRYPLLAGSEFLGPGLEPGETRRLPGRDLAIRHEDLTGRSFDSGSFDAVVTLDVFEHIPDYRGVFRECRRVLRSGGHLVFTVPFFENQAATEVRALVEPDGGIRHLLPPEIHGDPIARGGSLCFQHFGWDMLDDLRRAGFVSATANLYWAPWQGHIGLPGFVFHAVA